MVENLVRNYRQSLEEFELIVVKSETNISRI